MEYFVNYIIKYGYVVRVLRGVYYVKTIEEFKLRKSVNPLKVLTLGMNRLNVKWYFGLYTALRLNGLTHEYYDVIFVLNDTIYRPKLIKVAGEKVKFVKIKPNLIDFGIVKRNGFIYSDLEKTILDFIYLSRYGKISKYTVKELIIEFGNIVDKEKIARYAKQYPKTVMRVLADEGLL